MWMDAPIPAISRIKGGINLLGTALLDLCLPAVCAACGKVGIQNEGCWCRKCRDGLPWVMPPLCPQCGRPFLDSPDSIDHLCGECNQSAFHFNSARSAVLHQGIVRDRVHQFKFGGRLERVPPLVELLQVAYLKNSFPAPDLIVPVPLHQTRLKERGFNQSGLLAKEFARRMGMRIAFGILQRKDWTEPQTHLTRKERLKNVKGVFMVPAGVDIKGSRILLLDDVYTTGTTLSECAKTLKRKGVSEVFGLTVTRAPFI